MCTFVIRFFPLLRYLVFFAPLVADGVQILANRNETYIFKAWEAVSTIPWIYFRCARCFSCTVYVACWHSSNTVHHIMSWRNPLVSNVMRIWVCKIALFCILSMVNGNLLNHRGRRTITRFGFHFTARIDDNRFRVTSISWISTNHWLFCMKSFDTVDNARCACFLFDADHTRVFCSSVADEMFDRQSICPTSLDHTQ